MLEFGSGWSTYVIAQALHDNGEGFLYSVDGDRSWAQTNARALPPELAARCELRYARPQPKLHGRSLVLEHEGVPDCSPGIIYLDGPSLYPVARGAADVLRLEARLEPGTLLIVDGRHDNVLFLADALKRPWTMRSRGVRCLDPNQKLSDLVVLASTFELRAE